MHTYDISHVKKFKCMYDTSHLNIKCRQLRGGKGKKKSRGGQKERAARGIAVFLRIVVVREPIYIFLYLVDYTYNPGPLAPKASIIPLDHAASNWRLQKIF